MTAQLRGTELPRGWAAGELSGRPKLAVVCVSPAAEERADAAGQGHSLGGAGGQRAEGQRLSEEFTRLAIETRLAQTSLDYMR